MPSRRFQPLRSGLSGLMIVAIAATACDSSGRGGIKESDLDAELAASALRGDSLVALASGDSKPSLDSMRTALEAQLDSQRVSGAGDGVLVTGDAAAGVAANAASVATSAGAEISRRAQARGDSMARAAAMQLAGAAGGSRSLKDSLRGVLTYQGTEPARQVVLQTAEATVALSGMATTGMSRLVGKEVVVRGVKVTPRDIVVSDYIVRAVDGVPAFDGVLDAEGALRLTDGSGVRRLTVPAPLRAYVGARVWIAMRDGAAVNYGIVSAR